MSKAQKQKILKLNIKDKKLARLYFCQDLTQRDSLFLNYAYEERQHLHFRYAFGYPLLSSILIYFYLFRYSGRMTKMLSFVGVFGISSLIGTAKTQTRFAKLIQPYFEKYTIK